jgi:hypothetical protein
MKKKNMLMMMERMCRQTPLVSVALAKSQYLIESGVWNKMSTDQERLVAILSEVNMLKDHKLNISKYGHPEIQKRKEA